MERSRSQKNACIIAAVRNADAAEQLENVVFSRKEEVEHLPNQYQIDLEKYRQIVPDSCKYIFPDDSSLPDFYCYHGSAGIKAMQLYSQLSESREYQALILIAEATRKVMLISVKDLADCLLENPHDLSVRGIVVFAENSHTFLGGGPTEIVNHLAAINDRMPEQILFPIKTEAGIKAVAEAIRKRLAAFGVCGDF